MSQIQESATRYAATVTFLAGALATASIYLASSYITIERTVVVASIPVLIAGIVAAGAALYLPAE